MSLSFSVRGCHPNLSRPQTRHRIRQMNPRQTRLHRLIQRKWSQMKKLSLNWSQTHHHQIPTQHPPRSPIHSHPTRDLPQHQAQLQSHPSQYPGPFQPHGLESPQPSLKTQASPKEPSTSSIWPFLFGKRMKRTSKKMYQTREILG